MTEARLPPKSSFIGKTIRQFEDASEDRAVVLALEVERAAHGAVHERRERVEVAGDGHAEAGALDLAILGWIIAGFTPAYSADRQQLASTFSL